MSNTEFDLRNYLSDYLKGRMTFVELQTWKVPTFWDCHLWAPQSLQDLVYAADLLFAEYTSHHRTEEDLKGELGKLLNI
jgi:hypothetical protein